MADNETIADIIAEMRGFKRYAASDSSDCRYVAYWLYQTFADRLEAAHKRERGDCAKLREALKVIAAMEAPHNFQAERFDIAEACYDLTRAIRTARSALDAPPRNCDVGTAEEQNARHSQFCYAQMKRNNHCCGPCPCYKFINGEAQACTLLWAQMPYEEGGAE
jgi:hypothetical protein